MLILVLNPERVAVALGFDRLCKRVLGSDVGLYGAPTSWSLADKWTAGKEEARRAAKMVWWSPASCQCISVYPAFFSSRTSLLVMTAPSVEPLLARCLSIGLSALWFCGRKLWLGVLSLLLSPSHACIKSLVPTCNSRMPGALHGTGSGCFVGEGSKSRAVC